MVEAYWEGLRGQSLRYLDREWELTGDVDVLGDGDLVAVQATRADDVRRQGARLYFGLQDPPGSLNPGNMGEQVEGVRRVDDEHHLLVATEGRTYRYELQRAEHE